jgi:hypothetical protein
VVEFSNREDVERWLWRKPREVAIVIAARAALRAVPALASILGRSRDAREVGEAIILPVFRALTVTWAKARYPMYGAQLGINARAAVNATKAIKADYSSFAVGNAVAAAQYAAEAATRAPSSAHAAARAAAYSAAAGAAAADDSKDGVDDGTANDADLAEKGVDLATLVEQELWHLRMPNWALESWIQLKQALRHMDENWEVWTDWYDARIVGQPANEAVEIARAMIPDEIWKQGAKVVNAHIKRLIEKHEAVEEREIFDSAFVDDDQRDREAPNVPRQRAAAVEPIWDSGVLTVPQAPAPMDQGEAGFASALRAIRNVLRNFADEISGEANIDRRFVSFVRRVAEQIPEAVPPQHELFEIGHVEAVFAEYTRTVSEQWPNFLAARYHATVLQFDRTMRQSEAWRDFKRNAQETTFTDAQTREAADLANAAAAALRNDEAGEFVDPLVPQVLEQMADPRSRWPDDVLAAIEAGKEELTADLIESTNNVFKAIAEAALPVVTEAAAAARRTARKTAEAFWQEFEKGAVAEAKTRGKPAGRAAVRWLLRFAAVTGGTAGAAGAAYGGYAGFSKLMMQYPEAFGWLQQLLRFFQQALPPL